MVRKVGVDFLINSSNIYAYIFVVVACEYIYRQDLYYSHHLLHNVRRIQFDHYIGHLVMGGAHLNFDHSNWIFA